MIEILKGENSLFLEKHLAEKKRLQQALQREVSEAMLDQNTKNPTSFIRTTSPHYISENH